METIVSFFSDFQKVVKYISLLDGLIIVLYKIIV